MKTYDVVIVGAGAAGSVAARETTRAGLETLLLEAGPPRAASDVPPRTFRAIRPQYAADTLEKGAAFQDGADNSNAPEQVQTQRIQAAHGAFLGRGSHLFASDVDEPYDTPVGRSFWWIRGSQIGGRTLTWGGTCLRFSPVELDGLGTSGVRWPFRYAELEPYYDEVERYLTLCGRREGISTVPDSHYGSAPADLTPAERLLQTSYDLRSDTRPIDVRYISPALDPETGFPSFTAQSFALAAAERTGRLTLRPNAAVEELVLSDTPVRAVALRCVDRLERSRFEIACRTVLLCAGTIGTLRLLLQTAESNPRVGLGGEGSLLGRGLMEHPGVTATGGLKDLPILHDVDGYSRQRGLMLPPSLEELEHSQVRPFGTWITLQRGFSRGKSLAVLACQGELLKNPENRVELSRRRDRWGVRIPRITCAYGEREHAHFEAMRNHLRELARLANVVDFFVSRPSDPGVNVHELGGASMGSSPDSSVTDPFGTLWSCSNVVLCDGSVFPSAGWQNPTLTIMALALRNAREAVHRLQKE